MSGEVICSSAYFTACFHEYGGKAVFYLAYMELHIVTEAKENY